MILRYHHRTSGRQVLLHADSRPVYSSRRSNQSPVFMHMYARIFACMCLRDMNPGPSGKVNRQYGVEMNVYMWRVENP